VKVRCDIVVTTGGVNQSVLKHKIMVRVKRRVGIKAPSLHPTGLRHDYVEGVVTESAVKRERTKDMAFFVVFTEIALAVVRLDA